jgi:hypothetical protein
MVRKIEGISKVCNTSNGRFVMTSRSSSRRSERPIDNMMMARERLYEAGPLLTNHENTEGFVRAMVPPTVTYTGYKLVAIERASLHLSPGPSISDAGRGFRLLPDAEMRPEKSGIVGEERRGSHSFSALLLLGREGGDNGRWMYAFRGTV